MKTLSSYWMLQLLLLSHCMHCMHAGWMGEHDLQVSLDTVRDKNVMQLKKLNCAIFPVTYQDKFYTDALTSGDFTKLGKWSSQFQKFFFLFWGGGLSVGSSLFDANGERWIAWNSPAYYSDIVMCWGQLLADWRWGTCCWLWMVDLLETLQHITMTYVSVQLLADWRRGMVVGCSSISWLWGFLHPTGGLGLVWPTNSLLVIIISDYDFTLPSSILLIEYEHLC